VITIVFANQKGGVGKTTLGRNFFFYCVEMGLRVLGVDMESQHNFSDTLLAYRKKTITELIARKEAVHKTMGAFAAKLKAEGKQSEANFAQAQIAGVELQIASLGAELALEPGEEKFLSASKLFEESLPALPLLPCGESAALIYADRDLIDVAARALDEMLNPKMALARFAHEFDVCIIDTAPTVGRPLYAALAVADYVICPCTMDQDAINGATNLFEDIERVRMMGWNDEFKERWLVANQVDNRRSYHVQLLGDLKEQLEGCMLESVLTNRAATNVAKDYPVWQEQSGQSQKIAVKEMKSLCEEILHKTGVLQRKHHA
jgi:chromosome partitioning protein